MVNEALPCCLPARARIVTLPPRIAVAVVVTPVVGETVALLESLESQMNDTLGTSTSVPLTLLKARAVKVCVAPASTVADDGVTCILVIDGDPKGVPSVLVPGENTRPSEFRAVECGM